MSFAQEFLELTQKYTELGESIKEFSLNSLLGTEIDHENSPRGYIYHLLSAEDSQGYEQSCLIYEEDDGEEFYVEEMTYKSCDSTWTTDLQGCFDAFALKVCKESHPDLTPEQVVKFTLGASENLSILLGSFYLAVVEDLHYVARKEYATLKAKYPNEAFYPPTVYVDTSDLTHYESSRCW